MSDLENKLIAWAKPPTKAHEERCANAEKMVKNAIQSSDALSKRNITVFSQGSYANNTNTAKLSDVDVGVVCHDVMFCDYPDGMTREDFGFGKSDYDFATFKSQVGAALVSYFGDGTITRGNKAFDRSSLVLN